MVAKPLYPLYKNIIKPLDRVRYPELRYLLTLNQMKMKRETLKKILNFVITVLTAVASAFCVQSCQ